MNTIIFIETEKNSVGIWLSKNNINDAKGKKIRVARFTTCFNPEKNFGYYSETYLKLLIHRWKFYKKMKNKILFDLLYSLKKFPDEIIDYIIKYY